MADEPDAAGGGGFGGVFGPLKRIFNKAPLGNAAAQTKEFESLSAAIDGVTKSMMDLSQKSEGYAQKIAANFNKVTSAMSGGAQVAGQTAATQSFQQQRSQIQTTPSPAAQPAADAGGSRFGQTMMTAGSWLGGIATSDFASNMAMAPLRFTRDRIQNNRNVVLTASNMLNMTGLRAGVGQEKMLEDLSRNIGGVKGTPGELIQLLQSASQMGAAYGFGNEGATGVRGAGFFQGIRQMQTLNPGASVQSMVGALGGQAANTGANQQAMMMTGGAYSMIGSGGRQKSLSAWADSITKWLQDLRPGDKRGKAFTYPELMSQYYPGSNVDAWFDVNGISHEMREYWWTYVLGKANRSVATDAMGNLFQTASPTAGAGPTGGVGTQKNNLAALRLESTNALTQGEFTLGSKLSGSYGNREQSNRAFNEMIQSFLAQALPAALMEGPLASIAYMPDIIEDLLMGLLERAPGGFKTLIGTGAMGSALLYGMGDVGDVEGGYGEHGGTSTSGMHPDMRRKIGAMQRANPRIKVTSGLRDTALQQRLKKKGYKNVSGKASAHTRGMAADLGPKSEYAWIAQNANKFGLKSGKGHGEPWHVGMGDIPDIGEEGGETQFMNFLTSIFSGESAGAEGMFDIMGSLIDLLTGGLTTDKPAAGPAFEADLYQRLQQSARKGISGGKFSGGVPGTPTSNTDDATGPAPGGGAGAGTEAAGIAAAKALYTAGFKNKEDLEMITAISWRESKWDPNAKNKDTSDRGLMQINGVHWKGKYTEQQVLDMQTNANMAYNLWASGGANYGSFKQLWGFSEKSPYNDGKPGWDGKNGDPLGRTQGSHAVDIVEAANIPGLGDIPEYQTPMAGATNRQGNVVFVNTFNLQGGVGGGGANGGIDVRRTVTMMADHLEQEMKQRLSRVS